MKIEDLKKQGLEERDLEYQGYCHDCDTPVTVLISLTEEGEITVEGGAIYKIKQGFIGDDIFLKCDDCFKNDKTLRRYKKCEVYSRIVGYLRPVNQYNVGKKAEYDMRKEFTNMDGK